MPDFCHLHCHTQFSLLDGATSIPGMVDKAVKDEMKAVAITDHGNMFGAFKFVSECNKKGIKPIVGCEFYLVEDRHQKQFTREQGDVRYHQLLLAKNEEGYRNLTKLCSLGFIEGFYSKYPRIDKELILKYHKGLIATTCCIGAEIPQTILNMGETEAEEKFKWWLDLFGEDYYIELQRHNLEEQEKVNSVLMGFSKKYKVKAIVSNDSHYLDQENANAHDILLCINTGDVQSTPKGELKGNRFGFPNDQFFFKTKNEMSELFKDVPHAVENTIEIADKVDKLDLKRQIMLPAFPIPEPFKNADEFLRHLTYEGAANRYGEISSDIEERLNFELFTIEKMGFAGYFLIVSDFCDAAKKLNVSVGPGRGSAAGSAVAYCIGITNIDPIKYQLLFERFLNPERGSMPDIDTDFDDSGRQKVIDYVIDKYGQNQVAQIITYGSMKAKTSIKDVARALELPLEESNMLSKLVPEIPGVSFSKIFDLPENKLKEDFNADDVANIKRLREIIEEDGPQSKVLKEARLLEGSVRNAGVHASAVIIAPSDISEIIPVCTLKDSNMWVTQFDGKVVEDAGLLKMDFLGLRTLSIIKDALSLIVQNHNLDIDLDEIPLDDETTLDLFQKGDTNGIFQFESDGMKKVLRDLQPTRLEDLIAVNALFRPGPMEYIPNFVNRKHGREEITYDIDVMSEYLEDTYGITVYQEQVMLLSQKLANFSKADADTLRKAMGKKDKGTLDKMKTQFMEGCEANGHDLKICEKVWTDWEAFAQYAFNKSHATCYAYLAYQTAYLKAHYPSEFMSSILTHNSHNIEQISFFMDECKRMGLVVKGPDINESDVNFSVNKKGEIRFGLSAIKGIGEAATLEIIERRKQEGAYSSIFELTSRVSLRSVNKKSLEALAVAGAFDSWGDYNRAQYIERSDSGSMNGIEMAIKFGSSVQESKSSLQNDLFGSDGAVELSEPKIPVLEEWNPIEKLNKEKEVSGMFISGHPLDDFKLDIDLFTSTRIEDLKDLNAFKGNEIKLVGIITSVEERISKTGKPWVKFVLEDFSSGKDFALFGEDFSKFRQYLQVNAMVFCTGTTKTSYRNPNELEFKFTKISYLADLKESILKNIQLQIGLHQINTKLMEEVQKIVTANKGKAILKVRFYDKESSHISDTLSRKVRIDWNEEVKKGFERLHIPVQINQ
ncbi:MAG: DNA polymerase III subunit alpha [Flavobacteriales bacterium]|nr:DNA polymerase III subunit alpha [Flavobacteriales bacterium]